MFVSFFYRLNENNLLPESSVIIKTPFLIRSTAMFLVRDNQLYLRLCEFTHEYLYII